MAIKVNDKDGLDVVLRLDSSNRDIEIPDDILIASYSNLVDRGRKSFGNPFTSNHKVKAGLANKAHSVIDVIQRALDEDRISLLNNTTLVTNFLVLVSDNGTIVTARFLGDDPTAVVSGSNDEIVTITFPSKCIPISNQVIGPYASVSSGNRTFIFNGEGIPGNRGISTLYLPNIEKASITTELGDPSPSSPYPIDSTSPEVELVGIGTDSFPSLSIRARGVDSMITKHVFKFTW